MGWWMGIVAAAAGLYGAAGVALAAAAMHMGAGQIATIAADFLLFHAAALASFCAAARHARRRLPLMAAASLVAIGTLLFSGHLALHALTGHVPLPHAAPIGGALLIAGWLAAAVGLPLALGSGKTP